MNPFLRFHAEMRQRLRAAHHAVRCVLPTSLAVCVAALATGWVLSDARWMAGPVCLAVGAVVAATGLLAFCRGLSVADIAGEIDRSLALPDCALAALELGDDRSDWGRAAARTAAAALEGARLPADSRSRGNALLMLTAWVVVVLAGITGLPEMNPPPSELAASEESASESELAEVRKLAAELQKVAARSEALDAASRELARIAPTATREDVLIAMGRADRALQEGSSDAAPSPETLSEVGQAMEAARGAFTPAGLPADMARKLADLARRLDQSGATALSGPMGELAAAPSAATAQEALQTLQSAMDAAKAAADARGGMEEARLRVMATREALGKGRAPEPGSGENAQAGRAGSGAGPDSAAPASRNPLPGPENLVTADISGTPSENGDSLSLSLPGPTGGGNPSGSPRGRGQVNGRLSDTVIAPEELPLAYRGIVLRYFQTLRNPEP